MLSPGFARREDTPAMAPGGRTKVAPSPNRATTYCLPPILNEDGARNPGCVALFDEVAGTEGRVVRDGDDIALEFRVPAGDEAEAVPDGVRQGHGDGQAGRPVKTYAAASGQGELPEGEQRIGHDAVVGGGFCKVDSYGHDAVARTDDLTSICHCQGFGPRSHCN